MHAFHAIWMSFVAKFMYVCMWATQCDLQYILVCIPTFILYTYLLYPDHRHCPIDIAVVLTAVRQIIMALCEIFNNATSDFMLWACSYVSHAIVSTSMEQEDCQK